MSYGIFLKNLLTGELLFDEGINFYTTQRSGISTSDSLLFQSMGFTANKIYVSFSEFGNLIGLGTILYSNINFEMNNFNFKGVGVNLSKPTLVEICSIDAYEVMNTSLGIAETVFSSNISIGQKMIKNINDPNKIFKIVDTSPLSLEESKFNLMLNSSYLQPSSGYENFSYVQFNDSNITKYFIPIPGSPNFSWYELPDEQFYYTVDYYLTNTNSGFAGTNISISFFNQIIPKVNESILINNHLFDDTKSGLYKISSIKDKVFLKPAELFYNHIGQTFDSKINLDISTSTSQTPIVNYIPYSYGVTNVPFSKNLGLVSFVGGITTSLNYPPILKDEFSESKLVLSLNKEYQFTRKSDTFKLGLAVSNWCDNSTLFGVGLNYEIKEGY